MIISVDEAEKKIKDGRVVAVPTETVYGLAADCFNAHAVKETFKIKERPSDNPLIVHIYNIEQLKQITSEISPDVLTLAEHFWPGPLTLILPKSSTVPDIVTGGLATVAVRMPDHPLTLTLIKKTGPLTAPSANKSGRPSPTKAIHVENEFSGSVPVLEGGKCAIGLESTVLDLTQKPYSILRPGYVTASSVENALKTTISEASKNKKQLKNSPGTHYTHYKPSAEVNWFSPDQFPGNNNAYYITHSINPKSEQTIYFYDGNFYLLARDLYDHFRTADHLGFHKIFIEDLPPDQKHPMIAPLRDRINRASSY